MRFSVGFARPSAVVCDQDRGPAVIGTGQHRVSTLAAIAQLAARRSHNPKVVSSILTRRIFVGPSFCSTQRHGIVRSESVINAASATILLKCFASDKDSKFDSHLRHGLSPLRCVTQRWGILRSESLINAASAATLFKFCD